LLTLFDSFAVDVRCQYDAVQVAAG